MFNPEEAKYANGVLVELPYPTDDVRLMTKAAVEAVDRIYRPGFKYSKAEVLLVNLRQGGEYTEDLFSISQSEATEKGWAFWIPSIVDRAGRQCAWRAYQQTRTGHAPGDDEPEFHYMGRSALDGVPQVKRASPATVHRIR